MKSEFYIYTFGHSNVPLTTFLEKLKEHQIQVLVDVRTIPLSRYCPHFNQMPLREALATESIKYLFKGANLGGRGVNVGYEEAINELTELAKSGKRICVMCSEKEYQKCHRFTVLTPSLEERGLLVVHISYENETGNNGNKRD
jgi:uncharacterized protein (DUF488 family)